MGDQEKENWKLKLSRRLNGYLVILIFIFILLTSRLFFLQIVNAQEFSKQSAENRIRINPIEARRGDILDRNGQVLATSQPVYVVTIRSMPNQDLDGVINNLSALLEDPELTPAAIKELIKNNPIRYRSTEIKRLPASDPVAIATVTRLEEHRQDLPGVNIIEEPQRYYPYGPLAGHLLGYVGQITQQELEDRKEENYGLNDKIGKSGIEAFLEYSNEGGREIGLRGKKGAEQVEVDAYNRKVRDLVTLPPTPGDTVQLTIDLKLQQTLEKAMDQVIAATKKKNPKAGGGAAVVLDVKTGAILAMASKPDMDPNDFVNGNYTRKQGYYNNPRLKPLFNRAIQGIYPPGSTFKPITAMAALDAGVVKPQDTIYDSGRYWKPGGITCWAVHGNVNLYRGMAVSCNTYFQWAGELAGIDKIDEVARQFGLGEPTGVIGLRGEAAGILPSPEWKKEINAPYWDRWLKNQEDRIEKKYAGLLAAAAPEEKSKLLEQKERELKQVKAEYQINYNFNTTWQPFNTYNTSIGQGDNNYTIIQLANYIATLANGGTRWRPYLVDKVIGADGSLKKQYHPEVAGRVTISQEAMAQVRQAMLEVTRASDGTASFLFRDFPPELQVAAKTGTAQTGLAGDDRNSDFYGLFVAFAPFDDPQIAIAVIIEYAQHGGDSAGVVARAVLAQYFGLTDILNKPFNGVSVE
ncbi:MAG: penicillin-binding protein 2 [Moorella sp. (in: firmicutes)]|jgi:penicillin-binding protein 2|uniref:penicillin-binding protein 2 n=1 Tax=Moorella sp. E306M TaxID=2572683 RepID=UPI0010FFBF2E|nr:penicillin-binding protein 2 [Moorella sp. E306M]MDK2815736.1 penicillin-binding protein 2 [Moorella sp. (in: firmicutes)]MDK2894298.1 penicillin-binding protein 2 [Moorella sp. (in: firmicutes)]GEA17414.1 penicillin-binding protein 2 [Moorella sp. E306M]